MPLTNYGEPLPRGEPKAKKKKNGLKRGVNWLDIHSEGMNSEEKIKKEKRKKKRPIYEFQKEKGRRKL